jgi:hypothetical protein
MLTRSDLKYALLSLRLIAAAVISVTSSSAMANELKGYKGDRLKGSISCVHPNIINDLIERVGEEENFTSDLRFYCQHGYCWEADILTILTKPLADHTFKTWDGHEAEIWETVLRFDRIDGTSETLKSYSIVFPQEMEQSVDG